MCIFTQNYLIKTIMKNIYLTLIITLSLLSTKSLTAQNEFITLWLPVADSVIIPSNPPLLYTYDIEWFSIDDSIPTSIGSAFGIQGDYVIPNLGNVDSLEVRILGGFPSIKMFNSPNSNQLSLVDVKQWGNIAWQSFDNAFRNCANLNFSATIPPDLSLVQNMDQMFLGATNFNSDISNWSVLNIQSMSYMFDGASSFNQDIGNWIVGQVTNMKYMFHNASAFNQDIGNWITDNVLDMSFMFDHASSFNQDIHLWGVNNVHNMESMFYGASAFNHDIGSWNVGSVTNMNSMFSGASAFNQDIGGWDVSSVSNMSQMFRAASAFNQDINLWNVSGVTDMSLMFRGASVFNENISDWNVIGVLDMREMFYYASAFNQDIGIWDVSNVQDMSEMFNRAKSFNQDIGAWDVSSVTDMTDMFTNATHFDQSLENWVLSIPNLPIGLSYSGMSCVNFSRSLHGWANNVNTSTGINLQANTLGYSSDQVIIGDMAYLTSTTGLSWTITNAAQGVCPDVLQTDYVTVWNTDNSGVSANHEIEIPALGDYNYTWIEVSPTDYSDTILPYHSGSGSSISNNTIDFVTPGIYRVAITPNHANGTPLHRIEFNNGGDKEKLLLIEHWGSLNKWNSFANAYYGCTNLDVTAIDIPQFTNVNNTSYAFAETGIFTLPNFNYWDMTQVTDMSFMFKNVVGFSPDMQDWDVSSTTDMSGMFSGAINFNQDIGTWDVSNTTDMSHMFDGASSFDQDLSGWDVSNVTDMSYMFTGASAISNIGPADGEYHAKANGVDNWDVGQVVNMEGMFSNAIQFNGDIGNWDVGQVTSMKSMFSGAAQFNADLSSWDVSKVTDMSYMFTGASSLTSIGPVEGEIHAKANGVDNWDVGQVTSMTDMFSGAISFNGDLGNWDVGQLTANGIGTSNDISFANSGMSCGNYSLTLQGWASQSNTPMNIIVDATGMEYSPDITADRNSLINDNNWTFKGDSEGNCFLSIEELTTSSFTIYPNPAQEQFTITGLSGNETIQLADMTGRVLQTVKSQNNSSESIKVSQLANGVYNLVILTENGQSVTQKLIKQ